MSIRAREVSRFVLLAAATLLGAVSAVLLATPPTVPQPELSHPASAAPAGVPLSFEENAGQFAEHVRFVSRGPRYTQFITDRAVVWRVGSSAVFLDFPGASAARVTGVDASATRSHYLRGDDPARWVRDARQFSSVRLSQLYAGVDLVLYGTRDRPEYDFVLAPGASSSDIRLRFTGANALRIGEQGELIVPVEGGELIHHRPIAWQRDASGGTRWVDARFAHSAPGEVRFVLGDYDRTRELVIDPVYEYSTFLGGAASEVLSGGIPDPHQAIFVNGAGEAYIAGVTQSTDFPSTPGSLQPELDGDLDFFIARLNASGDALLYSTFIGGTGDEIGVGGVHVNGAGEILFAGLSQSNDFPTTTGAFDTVAGGGGSADVVALKINAAGNALVYSTYLGSSANERLYGFAVDSHGSIVLAGSTVPNASTTFPRTVGTLDNGGDQFITRLTADGSALASSGLIGTSFGGGLRIRAMALDADDNIYLTGLVSIPDMPLHNALDTTLGGGFDGFVAKLNPDATGYLFSTYLGGAATDEPLAIAVDSTGAVYVAGATTAGVNDFPTTTGTVQPAPAANWNGFLTKLAPAGNSITWSTYLLPPNYSSNNAIALDAANRVYVATIGNPPLALRVGEAPESCLAHLSSPSVVRVSADGTTVDFGMRIGGPMVFTGGSDISSFPLFDLAVDGANDVYLVGGANSPDFPTYRGFQGAKSGGPDASNDAYVAKLSAAAPQPMPTLSFSAATYAADESTGTATIIVNRTGRAAGPVKIRVVSNGGSATSGTDYTAVNTILEWRNGDDSPKTVIVDVASDGAAEGAETVNLELRDDAWCLGDVGARGAALLTIADAAAPPPPPPEPGALQLSAATYTVAEGAGNATITITRAGGSDGAVSVRLTTADGTASAADYGATDVIVSFPDGDAAPKTVTVPVTQDSSDEPDETVALALSAVTGGATLGTPNAATLTITDDDAPPAPPTPPAPPGGGAGGGGGGGGLDLGLLALLLAFAAARSRAVLQRRA